MKNPIKEDMLNMLDNVMKEIGDKPIIEHMRQQEEPKICKPYKFAGCISKCIEEQGKLPSEIYDDCIGSYDEKSAKESAKRIAELLEE